MSRQRNGDQIETFKSKNPAIRIHQRGIRRDRPPQRLHRHAHINNHHTVLGRGLPDTDILLRFHRDMREGDELRVYADARKLKPNREESSQSKETDHDLEALREDQHDASNNSRSKQRRLFRNPISTSQPPIRFKNPSRRGRDRRERERERAVDSSRGAILTVRASLMEIGALAAAMAIAS